MAAICAKHKKFNITNPWDFVPRALFFYAVQFLVIFVISLLSTVTVVAFSPHTLFSLSVIHEGMSLYVNFAGSAVDSVRQ